MGACCGADRKAKHEASDASADNSTEQQTRGSNSIFLRSGLLPGTNQNEGYNLVYRPPAHSDRLLPGQEKPQFWTTPFPASQNAAIVSVTWGREPVDSSGQQLVQVTRNTRNAKRNTKVVNISNKKSEEEEQGTTHGVTSIQYNNDSGDNSLMVKAYPDFLLPFVNKITRLRLVCQDAEMSHMVGTHGHLNHGAPSDPSTEIWYLIRNMRSLRLRMKYSHEVLGLPEVSVEENHGGLKRLRRTRYRVMPLRWVDMDHQKPAIKIVGDQFLLNLEPPSPNLVACDFVDGNGEMPYAVGNYIRYLDTCPDAKIQFGVRLFSWFNRTMGEDIHIEMVAKDTAHSSLREIC